MRTAYSYYNFGVESQTFFIKTLLLPIRWISPKESSQLLRSASLLLLFLCCFLSTLFCQTYVRNNNFIFVVVIFHSFWLFMEKISWTWKLPYFLLIDMIEMAASRTANAHCTSLKEYFRNLRVCHPNKMYLRNQIIGVVIL